MIWITDAISIDDRDLTFAFVRASGPGGQNINKVSTAVQLRFNVDGSSSLSANVKERLKIIAGKRLSDNGEIVIEAKRFRNQTRNREDAIQRLKALIVKASDKPIIRKKTKPSVSATAKRVAEKKRRSAIKKNRKTNAADWD